MASPSLLLGCPVWTEDADFFGTGVATWTTSRVKLYLSPDEPQAAGTPEERDGALRDFCATSKSAPMRF
jgi:hypothetical protein